MIKSVMASIYSGSKYNKLKRFEVHANAAMEAVLPRFIKHYRRAPHGRASSNINIIIILLYLRVAPHTGALVVTPGHWAALDPKIVAPHTGALVVTIE